MLKLGMFDRSLVPYGIDDQGVKARVKNNRVEVKVGEI